jgi:phage tail sheath protein FI
MGVYQSPGVYVEEVPSAIKAIAGVSTSTAAFIGVVPDKINLVAKDNPGPDGEPKTKHVEFNLLAADKEPKLITNWTQFTKQFGDLTGDSSGAAVSGAPPIDEGHRKLAHAVYGFFNNGGSRCFVTRISDAKDTKNLDAALAALAAIDEVALVAAPGMTDDVTRDRLVSHCMATKDRFAILDGPETVDDLTKLTKIAAAAGNTGGLAPKSTDLAAWYFPWVKVADPGARLLAPDSDGSINVPPSGHIAGVYARVDTNRGVFKAPANEPILGVLGVSQPISKPEQDIISLDGVNCIRALNGNIFVWGARTVGGRANADLKYINVRRTLLFLDR